MCLLQTPRSPAPSRINSAELPQRDVTVWEFAIFGYFPCIIRTVRTRSFNHKHKHRKMAIFVIFSPVFFCSLNWEFSYSNWGKNILFGIGNTTEYRSSKRAKKTLRSCACDNLVLERSFYTGTTPTNIQHIKTECCFVAIFTLYKYKLIKNNRYTK